MYESPRRALADHLQNHVYATFDLCVSDSFACHANSLRIVSYLRQSRRWLDIRHPMTYTYLYKEPKGSRSPSPYPFPLMTVPPITPDQAVDLAARMIAACDGNTFCTIGQAVTLANLAEHLSDAAALALNAYLAAGAVS